MCLNIFTLRIFVILPILFKTDDISDPFNMGTSQDANRGPLFTGASRKYIEGFGSSLATSRGGQRRVNGGSRWNI